MARLQQHSRMHQAIVLVLSLVLVGSCASTRPLPQPQRVVDPATISNALHTARWDIAVVGYEYSDQGLDYRSAGLLPVCLVVANKTDERPQILVEEARGLASSGEYLPYSVDEAVRLAVSSNAFSQATRKAAVSGGIGAAIGAGLGVLIGLLTGGNDLIWQGAIIGGAIGGASGAVSGAAHSEAELHAVAREELYHYAWKGEPLPPKFTRAGYLYFPGNRDIGRVKVVVRSGATVETYVMGIAAPPR